MNPCLSCFLALEDIFVSCTRLVVCNVILRDLVIDAPHIVKGIPSIAGMSGLGLNTSALICGTDASDQLMCTNDHGAYSVKLAIGQYTFDTDGDGVPNYKPDLYPYNSAESSDYDGDGIGDNEDTDDDSDGIPMMKTHIPSIPIMMG